MDKDLPAARSEEKKLLMLWKRKGTVPEARQILLRALPALLMLVLGLEALRIGTQVVLGTVPGLLLFFLPLRTLSLPEAIGAMVLGMFALLRGFQIIQNQVLRGLPFCLVLMDREVMVWTDGLLAWKKDEHEGAGSEGNSPATSPGLPDPSEQPASPELNWQTARENKPGFSFSLDDLKRLEIVPRRRRECSFELRAWGATPFSRVIAVSEEARDLEELRYKLQNPDLGS